MSFYFQVSHITIFVNIGHTVTTLHELVYMLATDFAYEVSVNGSFLTLLFIPWLR